MHQETSQNQHQTNAENNFTIELFGTLMLWDKRVEKLLKICKVWHPETDTFNHIEMEPNIYSIHSGLYKGERIVIFAFTKYEFESNWCETSIVGMGKNLRENVHKKDKKQAAEIIDKYIKEEIKKAIEITLKEGEEGQNNLNSNCLPYSSSITTIQILALE